MTKIYPFHLPEITEAEKERIHQEQLRSIDRGNEIAVWLFFIAVAIFSFPVWLLAEFIRHASQQ